MEIVMLVIGLCAGYFFARSSVDARIRTKLSTLLDKISKMEI